MEGELLVQGSNCISLGVGDKRIFVASEATVMAGVLHPWKGIGIYGYSAIKMKALT